MQPITMNWEQPIMPITLPVRNKVITPKCTAVLGHILLRRDKKSDWQLPAAIQVSVWERPKKLVTSG